MRPILAVLLILSCSALHAAEADERTVLAARVIDLMRVKPPELGSWPEQCTPSDAVLAKRLAGTHRKSAANFSGISPQSACRSDGGRVWREFFVAKCAEAPDGSAAAAMTRAYAEQMSVQDVRDAVSYWSSASGRAMVVANEQILLDLRTAASQDAGREPPKATIAYHASRCAS